MGSGISRLTAVSTLKASEANQDAMEGADKARDLVQSQKETRSRSRAFEDMVRDNDVTDDEYWKIGRMLNELGLSNEGFDGSWQGMLGNYDGGGVWHGKTGDVSDATQANNAKIVESARRRFEDQTKDLESQDKLGNFEIQDLMSRYNQNETLASSIQKKEADTESSVIGKV